APCGLAGATIVHPGAAAAARRWPADRFAALVRALTLRGHRVVVTGGPEDDALVERVACDAGSAAGRTDVAELAALVASARLVVSGDTGVAHLASAFARPSVTLFGPTPPAEWGPPAAGRHRVLWPAPPGYRGDPHATTVDPVLASIDVEAVVRAAHRAGAANRPTVPDR
ncbi:glycosyltransferase family 9 protein, partial [Streptomyces sp. SID3343]|uniref:glycosyltransferase family 9 protein n=1 Tax=Streptomyces sp. SID3343 TaxID=2690260 RepID=UPI00136E839D